MTKQRFKAYVTQAQKERDRRAAAQVLKKLVQFNALVVTPVLERVKTGGDIYRRCCQGLHICVCVGGGVSRRALPAVE
jgi:hypothetical protein